MSYPLRGIRIPVYNAGADVSFGILEPKDIDAYLRFRPATSGREVERRLDPADDGNHAKARDGFVLGEASQHLDARRRQPDFLGRLAQRRGRVIGVGGLDPTARKADLAGVILEVHRALGEENVYAFAAIDAACAARPGNVSRNTWIAEAIEEKLGRDGNSQQPQTRESSAHG